MKKHFPNVLTCFNLLVGFVGCYYVLLVNREDAFFFVCIAGICDFLDGFVARLFKVQSLMGKQLDSLADLISFGMLPAFFLSSWLATSSPYPYLSLIPSIVVVCSAIRLAKFNIDHTQTDSHFKGLPTPANALMITSLTYLNFVVPPYLLLLFCGLSCYLLISHLPLMALKFQTFSWKGNQSKWLLIITVGIGFIIWGWTFLPYFIPYYLLFSLFITNFSKNINNLNNKKEFYH